MGFLAVIEGLDGSGKHTQSELLAEGLRERGLPVRKVSFPDYDSPGSSLVKMYLGGEFGEKPDDVNAYAASSFYAVDRFASFKRDWQADFERGAVVADRYTTSNAIHQCAKLPEAAWDDFLAWLFDYEYAKLGIPAPALVIYLRLDPELSRRLLEKRYEGHTEREDIHERDAAYLRRCRRAADYCAARLGWVTVECSRDGELRRVADIQAEIMEIVEKELKKVRML